MSHLDEGTLHALLDGELDLAEASEVQSHLGACAACGSRLQEVKQFLAEADRLVGALEVPMGAAAPTPRSASRHTAPLDHPFREPAWEEPPVLLLPEDAAALVRRRRWIRAFRWAAMIAVVVGGGRLLLGIISPHSSLPRARDITTATRTVPPAVASREETRQSTSTGALPSRPGRVASQNRAPAAKTTKQPATLAAPASVDSADQPTDTFAGLADSAPAQTLAAEAAAESVSTDSMAQDTAAAIGDTSGRELAAKDVTRQSDDLATRRAAAEALAELDRERRRERAAAATAALPPATPAPTQIQPPTEAPPPPRTPEQRAQIYLRIGLDEAVKQLGGPVHVIEGMTPELIGLVNGRLVPGADPSRPVVRVVYLDARGRMILLDQQRMRTGQEPTATSGSLRWSVGDVMLYLRGEPGQEILRNLQRRVR